MTGDRAWEDDIVHSLKSLTGEDVPSVEIVLLDAIGTWLMSPDNPGAEYGEQHAGHLISTLFSALESARSYQPARSPEASPATTAARARVVDGAHELAADGWTGVSLIVSRLMPAVLAELQNNTNARGRQLRGTYSYLLYGVALGTGTEQDTAVLDGVMETFAGWDAILRDGFTVPWRRLA